MTEQEKPYKRSVGEYGRSKRKFKGGTRRRTMVDDTRDQFVEAVNETPVLDKIKQVIVMRKDLGCRAGKMISQGSHSSMIFLLRAFAKYLKECEVDFAANIEDHFTADQREWMFGKFTKICVRVDSEAELDEIYEKAKSAGLTVHMVEDSGLTEFHGVKTKTCLAIGPNRSSEIDPITSHLRLL
jgi:PTH2 family peptidyl-tRNA hydrolase